MRPDKEFPNPTEVQAHQPKPPEIIEGSAELQESWREKFGRAKDSVVNLFNGLGEKFRKSPEAQAETSQEGVVTLGEILEQNPQQMAELQKTVSKRDWKKITGQVVTGVGVAGAVAFGAPVIMAGTGVLGLTVGTYAAASIGVGTYTSVGLATMGGAAPVIASASAAASLGLARLGRLMQGNPYSKEKRKTREKERNLERDELNLEIFNACQVFLREKGADFELQEAIVSYLPSRINTLSQEKIERIWNKGQVNELLLHDFVGSVLKEYFDAQAPEEHANKTSAEPQPARTDPDTQPEEIDVAWEAVPDIKEQNEEHSAQEEPIKDPLMQNPWGEEKRENGPQEDFASKVNSDEELILQPVENNPWGEGIEPVNDEQKPIENVTEYDPERDMWVEESVVSIEAVNDDLEPSESSLEGSATQPAGPDNPEAGVLEEDFEEVSESVLEDEVDSVEDEFRAEKVEELFTEYDAAFAKEGIFKDAAHQESFEIEFNERLLTVLERYENSQEFVQDYRSGALQNSLEKLKIDTIVEGVTTVLRSGNWQEQPYMVKTLAKLHKKYVTKKGRELPETSRQAMQSLQARRYREVSEGELNTLVLDLYKAKQGIEDHLPRKQKPASPESAPKGSNPNLKGIRPTISQKVQAQQAEENRYDRERRESSLREAQALVEKALVNREPEHTLVAGEIKLRAKEMFREGDTQVVRLEVEGTEFNLLFYRESGQNIIDARSLLEYMPDGAEEGAGLIPVPDEEKIIVGERTIEIANLGQAVIIANV